MFILKENLSSLLSWLINNFPKYSFELPFLSKEAHEETEVISKT